MKLYDVGAQRPATDSARLSAANDLVQKTLAQHRLLSGTDASRSGGLPAMDGLLARLSQIGKRTAPRQPELPEGARFEQDT